MSTVTYHHQPGIHATRGAVPLAGTSHLYTVKKVLWPESIENFLPSLFLGKTLHVCCGLSWLGDVRFDLDPATGADVRGDAARLPFMDGAFLTVLCDPPYNGRFQWNHDLLSELSRVASRRIIFQHWFIPGNKDGYYKKDHRWRMVDCFVWQGQTYFGRAQVISVFDIDMV